MSVRYVRDISPVRHESFPFFDFLLIALSIMENRALSSTIAIVEIFISHYDCICLFPYILIFIIKCIYVYNYSI